MARKNVYLEGMIKRHPDGFGFFIPDNKDHPDVYIPRHSMHGIMTNDRVMVEAEPERGGDRFKGDIVKILQRVTTKVVGRFYYQDENWGYIKDEGKGWGEDLKIAIKDSKMAKPKELVAAEIISYPDSPKGFLGKVTEILGDAAQPLNDIKRVLISNNIPHEFPKAVEQEAKIFKEVPDEKDFAGRKDLRGLSLITIDGATAKDFDDAVYVDTNDTGFKLYVAIADVSHYVRSGTAIDKTAYERGTSVYFPNFVVPMLPEVLSNGLCSLNPHVPRLCVVAEMQFSFTGDMLSSAFYEAIMESKSRVTYGEAQEVIDGVEVEKHKHVKDVILRCADLARLLMAKRFKEGSLDLEIPETELVIDGSGVPIDILKSERLFSHRLIEEMMLAANVAVAKFLASKNIPAIYRIHEPPNEVAIRLLERYLWNFGSRTKLSDGKLQKRLTRALEEFAGKPEAQVLNILTLRSMSQAKYHMENVGHFGLGFEFYTHFTSPIRRYPDLIVHRLLKSQILKNSGYRAMSEDELLTAGTVLSACEQRSVKAERQIHAIKKARFMEKFVGQTFTGMISSVAKFGVFVMLREYDIDGLVRLDDLGPDRLEFDEENLKLIAKRSGMSYSIGDSLEITVASVDIEAGQINFVPSSMSLEASEGTTTKSPYGKKGGRSFAAPIDKPEHKGKDRGGYSRGDSRRDSRDKDHRSERSDRPKRSDRSERPEKRGKSERPQRKDFSQDRKVELRSQPARSEKNPSPKKSEGPNHDLLKMILGPQEYARAIAKIESDPKPSRKLQFAEKTKLEPDTTFEQKPRREKPGKKNKPNKKDIGYFSKFENKNKSNKKAKKNKR